VIGDRHGRHLAARRFIDDLFEVARTIEQTVIRVQMQVNESGSFHAGGYSKLARDILLRRDWKKQHSDSFPLGLAKGSLRGFVHDAKALLGAAFAKSAQRRVAVLQMQRGSECQHMG
jgi:hypothetical protein